MENWQPFFRKDPLSGTHLLPKKLSFSNKYFSKKPKEYIFAAGPHSIAFKPTLRWHGGQRSPAEPTMSVSSKISLIGNKARFLLCNIYFLSKIIILKYLGLIVAFKYLFSCIYLGLIFAINLSKYINFWNFIFIGNNFRKYYVYYFFFLWLLVLLLF